MHTPNSPKDSSDYSSQGENSEDNDSLSPIYNEATMNRPMYDEDEWLDTFGGILDILPEYNPVTMSFIGEED